MVNHYSISEYVKNVYSYIMTRITMPQARFIRRPVYIRGAKSLAGCRSLTTGRFCRFDLDGEKKTLFIGDHCEFGDMTHIVALNHVEIGNHVLLSSKCFISDTSHGSYKGDKQDSPLLEPNKRELYSDSVRIGDNVWLGENVVVLSGADIGSGCIVGANSVINRKIPENSIVVGNNKVIKTYNTKTQKWERTRGG